MMQVYDGGRKIPALRALEGLGEDEQGVFETLRVYQGQIFRKEEHLKRLEESAKSTGLVLPRPMRIIRQELETALLSWLSENKTPGGRGALILRLAVWAKSVRVWIGMRKPLPESFGRGMELRTASFRRSLTHASAPESKTNACQNAVLAFFDPEPKPDERLFLDAEGFVSEASVGNIFLVKKKCLFTPSARGILNGVTRQFVLECALLTGVKAFETTLTRHDFYNAQEVFLTNTSWEILPVRSIDGRRIVNAVPGAVTRKLQSVFKKRILSECRKLSSAAP